MWRPLCAAGMPLTLPIEAVQGHPSKQSILETPPPPPRHEVLLRMVQGLLFSVSCTWMMMFLSPPSGGRLNTSGNDEGPSEMRQWQIHL